MKFSTKVYIWFNLKLYSYSDRADKFIKYIINEGKLVAIGDSLYGCPAHAFVQVGDKVFAVWIANYPYADLSDVYEVARDGVFAEKYIYTRERPSRKTQIAFWEWMERQVYVSFSGGEVAVASDNTHESWDKKIRDIYKEIDNGNGD